MSPRRRRKAREYARIPVVIRGVVRVPVPPGLAPGEVERAAAQAAQDGLIFDAVGFVDGVRLAVEANVIAHLTASDEAVSAAEAALAATT